MLFAAASATLLELGRDPERLGAELGITLVLHTWVGHPLACSVRGETLSWGASRP